MSFNLGIEYSVFYRHGIACPVSIKNTVFNPKVKWHDRTSGRCYMLQLISVDSRHFTQPVPHLSADAVSSQSPPKESGANVDFIGRVWKGSLAVVNWKCPPFLLVLRDLPRFVLQWTFVYSKCPTSSQPNDPDWSMACHICRNLTIVKWVNDCVNVAHLL